MPNKASQNREEFFTCTTVWEVLKHPIVNKVLQSLMADHLDVNTKEVKPPVIVHHDSFETLMSDIFSTEEKKNNFFRLLRQELVSLVEENNLEFDEEIFRLKRGSKWNLIPTASQIHQLTRVIDFLSARYDSVKWTSSSVKEGFDKILKGINPWKVSRTVSTKMMKDGYFPVSEAGEPINGEVVWGYILSEQGIFNKKGERTRLPNMSEDMYLTNYFFNLKGERFYGFTPDMESFNSGWLKWLVFQNIDWKKLHFPYQLDRSDLQNWLYELGDSGIIEFWRIFNNKYVTVSEVSDWYNFSDAVWIGGNKVVDVYNDWEYTLIQEEKWTWWIMKKWESWYMHISWKRVVPRGLLTKSLVKTRFWRRRVFLSGSRFRNQSTEVEMETFFWSKKVEESKITFE